MSRKSPTVLDIGFRANTQSSFLLGSGTVTWGRPLTIVMSSILSWLESREEEEEEEEVEQ